jgi:predicted membrane-bound spermidine synthase
MSTAAVPRRPISDLLLLAIFGLSGFAALVYQVAWQRLLFATFGVDIESITIIVSTFMLGLGCGSLAGGWAADRLRHRRLELFVLAELAIAVFGVLSTQILPGIGTLFVNASLPVTTLVNFGLMLVPTTMMGATLPILVPYSFERTGNVGASIGGLYFGNTVGAALGAFFTGLLAFHFMSVDQAIYLAAACNGIVAITVLAAVRGAK